MRAITVITLVLSLMGCAGESRIVQETMAFAWESGKFKDGTLTEQLKPDTRYLKVRNLQGAVLLVFNSAEATLTTGVASEVWRSGANEIVKFQEGRLVSTSGLATDWLAVRYIGAPAWTQLLSNSDANIASYTRRVDLKRGYQFDKTQTLTLKRIAQPLGHMLQGIDRPDAVWFEETAAPSQLPSSIYAAVPNWNQTGQAKVVYTWHCIKADECFSFQEWSAQDQAKVVKP